MAVEIGSACRRMAGMALACVLSMGQAAWAQDKDGSSGGNIVVANKPGASRMIGIAHAAFITFSSARPHIESGKLRGLALAGTHRAAAMPDMPTFPELGYSGFSHAGWLAAFMPAGTPPDIVQRRADAIKVAVADPGVMEKMRAMGVEPSVPRRQTWRRHSRPISSAGVTGSSGSTHA